MIRKPKKLLFEETRFPQLQLLAVARGVRLLGIAVCLLSFPLAKETKAAQTNALPAFDFRNAATTSEWRPLHDISAFRATPDGLVIEIGGRDPYFAGPAMDLPPDQPLWLDLRLKSDEAGVGQVFYFRAAPSEEQSVRFQVDAGRWTMVRVKVPPLGDGFRLRIDPPGQGATMTLAKISFARRIMLSAPDWPQPTVPRIPPDAPAVRAGALELVQDPKTWGGFSVEVAGKTMACGWTRPLVGYMSENRVRWWPIYQSLSPSEVSVADGDVSSNRIALRWTAVDPDGAEWRIDQIFSAGTSDDAIAVETRLQVTEDRTIVFFPMTTLFPGLGSFGERKGQAVFPGLEYLADEPSSSEADVRGDAAKRWVPDPIKRTDSPPGVAGGRSICRIDLEARH